MQNLNYLLNKAYYEDFPQPDYEQKNKALFDQKFTRTKEEIYLPENSIKFTLKTVYPGLLIGLGYNHEAKPDFLETHLEKEEVKKIKEQAEIKLGFSLDYVTGLPFISGSTIKGTLRTVFKNFPDDIAKLLEIDNRELDDIESEIFGKDSKGRVVFLDAIPVATGKGSRLFGKENITPHPDPLKNPNPLSLLKVIPEVYFLFRFDLKSWDKGLVRAEDLEVTFGKILTNFGLGAKTNVGFGILSDETKTVEKYYMLKQSS